MITSTASMNRFMTTDTRPAIRKLSRVECIKIIKAHGVQNFDQTQPAREMQKLIAASKMDIRKGVNWVSVPYEDENGRSQVREEPLSPEPKRTVDSQAVLEAKLAKLSQVNDERQKLAEENMTLVSQMNEMKAQMAELMAMMSEKKDDAFAAGIKEARAKGLKEKAALLQQATDEEKSIIAEINRKAQAELTQIREQIKKDTEVARVSLLSEIDDFANQISQKILGRAV